MENPKEVKQPAGVLPASKNNGASTTAAQPDQDLRLLVLADQTASFYQIVNNTSNDTKAPPFFLQTDATLP
jgi:hypothetical protein